VNIGDKIKETRIKRGLKQSDLAEKAGISRVAIGNYERNDRQPGTEQIEKIANALEVSPVDLMGWGYWDKKTNIEQVVSKTNDFENYLSTLGYTVQDIGEVTKWHYEDETDEQGVVIGRSQVEDESDLSVKVIRGKFSTVFSGGEYEDLQRKFEELQTDMKTIIEERIRKQKQK
jgi:transcriptional regulator with XRE-family HTH domain